MKNGDNDADLLRKKLGDAYDRVVERNGALASRRFEADTPREHARGPGHSRKMEVVGQLAETLAQYFNNILTVIIGYGSYLQMKLDEKDPLRPYVHQILASSEKAALLTRGLLTFSRKQVVNPKPVGINEIIRRAARLIGRIVGERIELRTSLSRTELNVLADAVQLEQVMMNLATNARDAMPEGGAFTIETKTVEYGDVLREGPGWRCALISFSDTGKGMNREVMEQIFEPFYTTKEPGKAAGLGLSIVYGIIKQHNGSVNVTSCPGMGTTLSIYLPLLGCKAAQDQPGTPASAVRSSLCS